jgi:hypothetical protein
MSYIGKEPADSFISFAKQDFTTSATTSYTLDNAVANENELALFINFVRQEPTTAYTASGTTLTLTSATTSSDDMYCVYLGQAKQTVNAPDGSVGSSQVAASIITGQTALGATPADTDELLISDAGTLKRVDYSYLKSANTPMFMAAYTGSGVTINDATDTKGTFDTEFIDVGSVYDTSTSRYTPGFVGKSFISTGMSFYSSGSKMQFVRVLFYKNGSSLTNATDNPANDTQQIWISSQLIVDHNATDYFEVYLRSDTSDGSAIEVPISSVNAAKPFNYFQGFKLIT